MKCNVCGKEISSRDRFCSNSGTKNYEYVDEHDRQDSYERKTTYQRNVDNRNYKFAYEEERKEENATMGTLAIVFSILGTGWLGLILAIIGLTQYKEEQNRTKCKIAIGITFAWIFIWVIVGLMLL